MLLLHILQYLAHFIMPSYISRIHFLVLKSSIYPLSTLGALHISTKLNAISSSILASATIFHLYCYYFSFILATVEYSSNVSFHGWHCIIQRQFCTHVVFCYHITIMSVCFLISLYFTSFFVFKSLLFQILLYPSSSIYNTWKYIIAHFYIQPVPFYFVNFRH